MFASPRPLRRPRTLLSVVFALVVAACSGVAPTTTPSAPSTPTDAPSSPTLPPDPNRLMTVAGGGTELGDGGPATSAGLCGPNDIAVDKAGNLYISDGGLFCGGPGGHTVRRVDPNGIITTVAGTGVPGLSGDGGPATAAQLNAPMSVAVDPEGNLYIAEIGNPRIRRVDLNGTITTMAGTGERGFSGDGGPAIEARLFAAGDFALGMAFDVEGNLYVADGGAVRKIDPSGTITTVAGTGSPGFSGDGGPATEARVDTVDVAVDLEGNIYLADYGNRRVRRVDPDGVITTVAGDPNNVSSADGVPATSVVLLDPWGIAVDADGNVYVGEHHGNRIRLIDREGVITTVAGILAPSSMGQGQFNGEEGPATHMHLNEPIGLFVDADGVLYIADTFNGRVRAVRFAD